MAIKIIRKQSIGDRHVLPGDIVFGLTASEEALAIQSGDASNFLVTEDSTAYHAAEHAAMGVVTTRVNDLTGGIKPSALAFESSRVGSLSVGVLGDSISAQNFDYSTGFGAVAGDSALSTYGWATWWQFFSAANLNFTKYAVAGWSTLNVINTQLDSAIAAGHDLYTLAPIGINDAVKGVTPSQTYDNIIYIAKRIVAANARLLIGSPTPIYTNESRAANVSAALSAMRWLAVTFPNHIRYADFNRAASDPSGTNGDAYNTVFDDLTYDNTHPNIVGACQYGWLAHQATHDWTAPYRFPSSRGDSANLLPNGVFGGVSGSITSAGTNSVSPDNWTANRGAATVTYSMFKSRRMSLIWKTGVTFPVGARVVPPVPNGCNYIVITSAATGATPPSATAMFGQSQPDAGGPIFVTVPVNDAIEIPEIGEDVLLLASSSAATASDYAGLSNATIDATAMAGKKIKVGLFAESLGSIPATVQLRVEQYTAGATRIMGAFGMMLNSQWGTPVSSHSSLGRGRRGLIATPAFTVDPTCVQLRIYIRAFMPGNGYQTATLLSNGFLAEVE